MSTLMGLPHTGGGAGDDYFFPLVSQNIVHVVFLYDSCDLNIVVLH
jgi:hypothetical protein